MIMHYLRFIISSLLLLTCATASGLELIAEDDPPHNMLVDGKIVGISTEKLEEAFKRIGARAHISLMPWARAYQAALTRPDHCVFSTARITEREALFQWIGPVASMDWVLYRRADNPVTIMKLEDVGQEPIGGYLQDVISVWLADHGYRVDTAPNDAVNPRKLLVGRFNYWASSRPRATALLEKDILTKRIVPVLTFGHTDLYLACHLSTPNDLIKKLNVALRHMQEDGTAAQIEVRYAH